MAEKRVIEAAHRILFSLNGKNRNVYYVLLIAQIERYLQKIRGENHRVEKK